MLYLYDTSWSLEQEGARIVVGHTYHVVHQQPEDLARPVVLKKMRKWLTLSELGHLLGEGANLVDPRKFGRSGHNNSEFALETKIFILSIISKLLCYYHVLPNLVILLRLVTGLMDRLEHKMGREGLRNRVRIVASQMAKTAKGKENVSVSPRPAAPADKLEIVPPPVGKEIPRTPSIPRGEITPTFSSY